MARPATGIVNQIGVESTPGTNVTAGKKLSSTSIMFEPSANSSFYRAAGGKFPTTGVLHRKWAVGSYEGILSYNEIVYILAGLFGHGSVTTATLANTWPFTPSSSAADSYKTYTVQRGDSSAAQEVAYGTFTSLNLNFAQDGVSVSGDFIAQAIDNTVSLDSVSATIAESPVSMADVDVYLDSTYGGVGTTKITDVLSATLSIPAKVAPKFVLNTTYASFREMVEVAVEDARLTVTVEYNAQSRAFYDALYIDSLPVRYLQIKAVGDALSATTYLFKANVAAKLESCRMVPDDQNVFAIEFNFRLVHDATMGRALEFTVINAISAL